MAVSLGYADTLMSLSAASTSSELSDTDKAAADISDGYVRMSVGITGGCGCGGGGGQCVAAACGDDRAASVQDVGSGTEGEWDRGGGGAATTSSELSDSDKAAAGIFKGYVRMSVGITGVCLRVGGGGRALRVCLSGRWGQGVGQGREGESGRGGCLALQQ
jgi:hypothetical protein